MSAAAPLKTKKRKQLYIFASTHKKLRTLAALRGKPMQLVADSELSKVVDAQIAEALLSTSGADFKRQANGKRK